MKKLVGVVFTPTQYMETVIRLANEQSPVIFALRNMLD